jgi:hypothetical protein
MIQVPLLECPSDFFSLNLIAYFKKGDPSSAFSAQELSSKTILLAHLLLKILRGWQ